MKALLGLAALLVAGVLTWQIGARLSTDSIGMGVGLIFGVLAGIPASLLVFATGGQRNDDDAYEAGYRAGIRDTTDLARGAARQLPEHGATQRPAVIVVNAPAVDDLDDAIDGYTIAYPFGHQRRQFRITGEVE